MLVEVSLFTGEVGRPSEPSLPRPTLIPWRGSARPSTSSQSGSLLGCFAVPEASGCWKANALVSSPMGSGGTSPTVSAARQHELALDSAVADLEEAVRFAHSVVIDFAKVALEGDDRHQIDTLHWESRVQVQHITQRLRTFEDASLLPGSRQARFAAIIGRQVVALDAMSAAVALIGLAGDADRTDIVSIFERGQAVVESSDIVIAAMRRSDDEGVVTVARMKRANPNGSEIDANDLLVDLRRLRET